MLSLLAITFEQARVRWFRFVAGDHWSQLLDVTLLEDVVPGSHRLPSKLLSQWFKINFIKVQIPVQSDWSRRYDGHVRFDGTLVRVLLSLS